MADRIGSSPALRPRRADAARNFDAILEAARRLFDRTGTDTTMPEIASAAGVGIATLYRNFTSREELIEAVYVAEVEQLCGYATELAELPPDGAFDRWLTRFLGYMMTKRALADGLNRNSAAYRACREMIYRTGGALIAAAQERGTVRADVDIDDAMRFVMAISLGVYTGDEQRTKVLAVAVDGLHAARR